mmetsp:Transcript_22563/g.45427  ORF Transcript_22563/g.45427 Transcript_22563/m.45427 type:complete len:443 (+) Transcript_22563:359-1687(+)
MDALKALVQQKQAIVASTSSSTAASSTKKKRYLTASQRRQIEQEEEERQSQQQQGEGGKDTIERKKKKKRKRNKQNDDDSSDQEGPDLTTLLTTKRYPALDKKQKKSSADNDDDGGATTSLDADNGHGTQTSGRNDNGDAGSKRTNSDENCQDNIIMGSLCQLSQDQVTNKLRSYGLPIRLFGEITTTATTTTSTSTSTSTHGDFTRLQRLYTAIKGREEAMLGASEKDEFLLHSADRTRNVFLENANDTFAATTTTTQQNTTSTTDHRHHQQQQELTAEEQNDKPKRIYRYFKSLLRQWEAELNSRPDAIKRTMPGKNDIKTLKQCKDYIRPLFTLCKRREIEESLQNHLFNIVLYCEEGEFVKAHDAYLDVAIGRAAWPIGVTMVGIHARSGRAKIESANVAHVMNSELQRKYLTSVKRLMSFAQRVRVDVDPSKKVVNL